MMSSGYARVNQSHVDVEDPPPRQGGFLRNEVQQDPTNKMWSEYLKDVEEYDTELSNTWKEDAGGLLTFTAIFSATVAAFIIESYKMLSPASGDQTVFLLGQISQQLSGLANGTIIQPQSYPSSPPSASIICVNGLWLLSLVFSTTSALFATMTQQWARRYLQLPKIQSLQSKRARVRSYLFLGTLKYAMYHAVETAPTLLHLSVFLFNIGLVIFFFTIYKTMAIIVLVSVALFGVAYFMVTILPCLDRICPYCTPMSNISWYLWHFFTLPIMLVLQVAVRLLHTLLVPYNEGDVKSRRQETLKGWLDWIEETLHNQSNRLRDGYSGSIVKDALEAPQNIDVKALTWLFQLPALSEEVKLERYVAGIPGEIIVKLFIEPAKPGHISFPEHLSSLLRSCALDTTGFDGNTYKGRVLVCLDAVRHIAKDSVVTPDISPSYESALKDVRNNFANIGLMRKLWATRDPAIRMTARSICALLAQYLLHQDNLQLGQPELAWLQDVLGERSGTIYNHRGNYTVLDNMAIDSFVYGSLSNSRQTDYPDLQISQATSESFIDSLVILTKSGTQIADIRSDIRVFADKFGSLIRRIEESSHQHRDSIIDKLQRIFRDVFPSSGSQSQLPNT